MDVGAGLYMYVVVVQKFTFAISSPYEFLFFKEVHMSSGTSLSFNLACACLVQWRSMWVTVSSSSPLIY